MAFTQLKLLARYDRNGSLLKTAVIVSCGLHLGVFVALSQYTKPAMLPTLVYQTPLSVQLQALPEPTRYKPIVSNPPQTFPPITPVSPQSISREARVKPKKSSVKPMMTQPVPPSISLKAPHQKSIPKQAPAKGSVPDLSVGHLLSQAKKIGENGGERLDPNKVSHGVFGQTAKGMVWDAYVEGWQRKVERIGQANYPSGILPDDMQGVLTLSVIINQNGSLASVRVVRSSGLPKLDLAAMDIVKQAAPYAPFPPHLAQSFQTLEIKRRWRFSGNQAFQ